MSDHLPTYNLRAVTKETGLSPETLRAWERRYGVVKPQRTPGGHRLYSKRDIRLLKWLVERQDEGLSISRAVELWRNLEESGQDPLAAAQAKVLSSIEVSNLEELRRSWISACKEFNEKAAEQVVSQAFAVAIPETVVIEILQKGVAEIGQQWYEGQATVQQEHFASSLATRRLHSLVAAAPPASRAGRILSACPPGEDHEFALLLSTFLLKRQGWDVIYLGANVPLAKMEATLHATAPNLVVSLAQTLPAAASLRNMALLLESLRTPLAFGGAIFNQLPELIAKIPGHYLGNEISNVPRKIDQIGRAPDTEISYEQITQPFQRALENYSEKQPLIEAFVSVSMSQYNLPNGTMEQAKRVFHDHLIAALALGDTKTLDTSIRWVEGLLQNYGMPMEALTHYLETYQKAIQEHLGKQGAIISEALLRYQEQKN
jgi:MerR family transcriptional regulator, light-induced transcriptional regulator